MRKYILTENKKEVNGIKLYQIQAVRSFGDVKEGDLGGWVASEENLIQEGEAWIYQNARVYEQAKVFENAKVDGDAEIKGNVLVYGEAKISGEAIIETMNDLIWFPNVESHNETLTAYWTKSRGVEITLSSFRLSIEELELSLYRTYSFESLQGCEYSKIIQELRSFENKQLYLKKQPQNN